MITKKEFERYERVRKSGQTNMFIIANVEILSDLPREKILYIMENYEKLKEDFDN